MQGQKERYRLHESSFVLAAGAGMKGAKATSQGLLHAVGVAKRAAGQGHPDEVKIAAARIHPALKAEAAEGNVQVARAARLRVGLEIQP